MGYNDGVFDGASNITALVCDSLGDGWKQYLWEGDSFVHVRTNKKNNDDNSDNGNNNKNNSTDQKCVGNSVPMTMQPSIASNSQMIAAAWAPREEVVVQRAKMDVRFRLREYTIRHIPLKPAMGTSSVSAWQRTLIPERIMSFSLIRMQLLLSAMTELGTFTHLENTRRYMYVFLFINTTRERGGGRKRKTKKTVLTINVSV